MKEITYENLDDYLTKCNAYDDPKVIKLYILEQKGSVKAITFMKTWLMQWVGNYSEDTISRLKEEGHRKGKIEEITPLGRLA